MLHPFFDSFTAVKVTYKNTYYQIAFRLLGFWTRDELFVFATDSAFSEPASWVPTTAKGSFIWKGCRSASEDELGRVASLLRRKRRKTVILKRALERLEVLIKATQASDQGTTAPTAVQ